MVMPQGLQIYNSDGSVRLDVTTRLTKVLGSFTFSSSIYTHTDNAISEGEVWYIVNDADGSTDWVKRYTDVDVTVSGNTITCHQHAGTLGDRNYAWQVTYGIW